MTSTSWLQTPAQRLHFLGPHDRTASARHALLMPHWQRAFARMPHRVAELLRAPTRELVERCAGLPSTIYHGDLKVGNLAVLPDNRLAAYDWGLIGAGPATFDPGWHLFNPWRFRSRAPE